MAQQPVTMRATPLIETLPPELFLMILDHVELVDLVTLYFLNPHWTNTFDSDNGIREKMFRLPREKSALHADDGERTAWVQEQWIQVQAKMKDDETSAEDFWKHIRVNPLLKGEYNTLEGYISETYTFAGQVEYAFPDDQHLTPAQSENNKALIEIMYATYPPVTRIHSDADSLDTRSGMQGHFPQYQRNEVYTRICGLTVRNVLEVSQYRPSGLYQRYTQVLTRLWPEIWWLVYRDDLDEDNGHPKDMDYWNRWHARQRRLRSGESWR